MAKGHVSHNDVISFFENADLALAELVHELATGRLAIRQASKAEASERMKKARAGRGKAKAAPAASTEQATEVEVAEEASA